MLFGKLGFMPHLGIAVATAIGGWLNALLLWSALKRRGHFRSDARLRLALPMIVLASALMGGVLWLLTRAFAEWLAATNTALIRLSALAVLTGIGVIIYFALAHVTGAARLGSLRAAFARGKGA